MTDDTELDAYLARFAHARGLTLRELHAEMDRVWRELGLDNRRPLAEQADAVAAFYRHPVWVLNGLFAGLDPESLRHRRAIARYVANLRPRRIADFGGGGGALAECLVAATAATVDVIEPFAHPRFEARLAALDRVELEAELGADYDVVIAQDVLEHVDTPVALAARLVRATRWEGTVVFANCFQPVIECHLPSTFHLRFLFPFVLRHAGVTSLGSIPGARHALAFRRERPDDEAARRAADTLARQVGPALNRLAAGPIAP
jgi:SAM-dependent methyltransferase